MFSKISKKESIILTLSIYSLEKRLFNNEHISVEFAKMVLAKEGGNKYYCRCALGANDALS